MELMIKHSEFLTIIIQALFITLAGIGFIGCLDEFIHDIKRIRKIQKKGGSKTLRKYNCSNCGFGAWALDHILVTKCNKCGATVETKPMPKNDESYAFGGKHKDRNVRFAER